MTGGEIVASGGDLILAVGEPGDGVLDLGAQVLDPVDRVLLVLVDALEVGGVDRGVLPARGLEHQLHHVRVVRLVDADENLGELLDGAAELLTYVGEMLAALLELVGGGVELLLLGGEVGGGGGLGLARLRDLPDQRVDLRVAAGELIGDRRLLVLHVGQCRLLGGDRRRGGRCMQQDGKRADGGEQQRRCGQEAGGRSSCPGVE